MPGWCREGQEWACSELDGRSTQDTELCADTSYWRGKTCGGMWWGRVRCTGSRPGECVQPGETCTDHSNDHSAAYCEADRRCKVGGEDVCLEPASGSQCEEGECQGSQGLENSHGKVGKCIDGSCQWRDWRVCADNFDYRLITAACEEKQRCKVGGQEVCLHPDTICDLHPACDGGEDEEDCQEEYTEKGFFHPSATFPCQSPHHNEDTVSQNISTAIVWILATVSDGIPECWKEVDEADDSIGNYFLGKFETGPPLCSSLLFMLITHASRHIGRKKV
jgi:hypothetical protein